MRTILSAFVFAVHHDDALAVRDDVAFFHFVRVDLAKRTPVEELTEDELDQSIRQIISRAITPEDVVDFSPLLD